MANDIVEMILDRADDNLIYEAGRDASEAIAKAIGPVPDVPRMTPEDFADRVCEAITRGAGGAADTFAAGIADGLKTHYQQLQECDAYL